MIALHYSSGAHLALISSPVLGVFAVLEDLGLGSLSELLLVRSVSGCQDRGAFVGDESETLFWLLRGFCDPSRLVIWLAGIGPACVAGFRAACA